MIIGKALKLYRTNVLKISQRELQQRINVSQSDISQIEHDEIIAYATYERYEKYFERSARYYGYSKEQFAKLMIVGDPNADVRVCRL